MNEPAKMVKTIRTIKGFIDWLEEVKGPFVLYRGLADADWEVESSAYRRIKRSEGEVPPSVFQNYIERLLDRAGLQGFKRREGDEFSDLELLAELQHNGAATCLIDFTSNALVALWFACREDPEKSGKVVAMATDSPSDFSAIDFTTLKKSIKDFLNQDKLWKWKPSNLNHRIVAQGSFFVFGEGKIEERRYKEIRINRNNKQKIREELKEKFGISEESLFSDFTGFALSNAHDRPYSDYTKEDYVYLGLAFDQQGNFEKAIDTYNKAIELAPQYAWAYNNRGFARRVSGDPHRAITDFNQAIVLNSQYVAAYNNRGLAKHDLNDYQGAIADFDQAIQLNPQDASAYNHRGAVKYDAGDHRGGIADFDQAIQLNPKFAEAYFNRGLAKYYSGDFLDSIIDFDQAISLNPQYVDAYNNRAGAKHEAGDFQSALADYNQAIELETQYAKAYYGRGFTKRALGDEAGAQADFAKAQELDPSLEPPESP